MWFYVAEQTGVPGGNHRPWTGDHYPADADTGDRTTTPVRLGGASVQQEYSAVPYSNTPHHTSSLRGTTTDQLTLPAPVRVGDASI